MSSIGWKKGSLIELIGLFNAYYNHSQWYHEWRRASLSWDTAEEEKLCKAYKINEQRFQIFLMVYATCVSYLLWDLKFRWPYRCSLLDLLHWFSYNIFFLASLTRRHWCNRWRRSCSVCNTHLLENKTLTERRVLSERKKKMYQWHHPLWLKP